MLAGDVLAHNLHHVRQGHHRTTDNEVEEAFLVFAPKVFGLAVLQSDGGRDLLYHADLLARTIDEFELTLREENGKGNARKTTARAEVKDAGAGAEVHHAGNGQRVKDVMEVEIVDILTRDNINLLVPFVIEGIEGTELLSLNLRQLGEILF